jgi:hypothetical protein
MAASFSSVAEGKHLKKPHVAENCIIHQKRVLSRIFSLPRQGGDEVTNVHVSNILPCFIVRTEQSL